MRLMARLAYYWGPITDEIDVPIETAKKLHTLAEEEWEDLDNESKKDRANGKKKASKYSSG